MREISGQRAVFLAMRVRTKSKDTPVKRTKRASMNTAVVIASPTLLALSTGSFGTTPVPPAVERAKPGEGDQSESTSNTEGLFRYTVGGGACGIRG